MIIFVDDVHLKWQLKRLSDRLLALSDLDCVLRFFRMFGFTINLDKERGFIQCNGKRRASIHDAMDLAYKGRILSPFA